MLSPWIYLMMNGLFFTLRLSGGSGSFPRPLKAAEEREYLERAAQGDLEARNLLVEHNLRLVAHFVKKYFAQTGALPQGTALRGHLPDRSGAVHHHPALRPG